MADLELRLPKNVLQHLSNGLRWRGDQEPVVFALASQAQVPGKTLILVREVIVPPASAFLKSEGHGARWSGAYMVELLNHAVEKNLGLFIFHPHGEIGQVRMSRDDLHSAVRLLPKFQLVQPKRPHGSIVVGPDSAAGLILPTEEIVPIDDFGLRLLSEKITRWPLPKATPEERTFFQCEPLVDTHLVRALFQRTTVAVVGLSGGGTQVVTQLARLGVGEIIGIDNQRLDKENAYATDEITWLDLVLRRRKTAALRSKVWWISPRTRFTPVDALVPEQEVLLALKRADIMVGCLNNLHARADLMEVAWRYCIPYIDIGLGVLRLISVSKSRRSRQSLEMCSRPFRVDPAYGAWSS